MKRFFYHASAKAIQIWVACASTWGYGDILSPATVEGHDLVHGLLQQARVFVDVHISCYH